MHILPSHAQVGATAAPKISDKTSSTPAKSAKPASLA